MKRVFLLGGFAFWLMACNSDRAGTGGNPARDSVVPTLGGHSDDKGDGQNKGGSSDPMNGGGPQTLNHQPQGDDSLNVVPNTDTAANRRTPAMQKVPAKKQ